MKMKHLALCSRLYLKAIRVAYQELQKLTLVKQPVLCPAQGEWQSEIY
jgi:hypothetical protein